MRCIALVADKLFRVGQGGGFATFEGEHQSPFDHGVADRVNVRARLQRRGAVQHVAGVFNDLGAALFVVARAFGAAVGFRNDVGAIQRVVQRTPTRIGGVQGVAGIQDGHDQLGAGLHGQLSVDAAGADLEGFGRLDQIANALQKRLVGLHVGNRAGVGLVPSVKLGLQAVAFGQQGQVFRGQVSDDGIKAAPEVDTGHTCAGQNLLVDELVKRGGYLESVYRGTSGHVVGTEKFGQ